MRTLLVAQERRDQQADDEKRRQREDAHDLRPHITEILDDMPHRRAPLLRTPRPDGPGCPGLAGPIVFVQLFWRCNELGRLAVLRLRRPLEHIGRRLL